MSQKETESHPAIPPNCELFMTPAQVVQKWPQCFWPIAKINSIFFAIEVTRIFDLANDYIPWNWRMVITAVARAAWLDEQIRLLDLPLDLEIDREAKRAGEYAEEWRLWGIQK